MENSYFHDDEKETLLRLTRTLMSEACSVIAPGDFKAVKAAIAGGVEDGAYGRDRFAA